MSSSDPFLWPLNAVNDCWLWCHHQNTYLYCGTPEVFFCWQERASWHAHKGYHHVAQQCLSPCDPCYQRHTALNVLEGVRLQRNQTFRCVTSVCSTSSRKRWRALDSGHIKMSMVQWCSGAVVQWFHRQLREFFLQGIYQLVGQQDPWVNIHRDYFQDPPVLHSEQSLNQLHMKKPRKCLILNCHALYKWI